MGPAATLPRQVLEVPVMKEIIYDTSLRKISKKGCNDVIECFDEWSTTIL
jgi:hypothetical protein